MSRIIYKWVFGIAVIVACGRLQAETTNYVANGGFEITNGVDNATNTFEGWTEISTGAVAVSETSLRLSGARSVEMVPLGANYIYQDIANAPTQFTFACKFAIFAGATNKSVALSMDLFHDFTTTATNWLSLRILATNSATGRKWVEVYSNTTWVAVKTPEGDDMPVMLSTDGNNDGRFNAPNDTLVTNRLVLSGEYGNAPTYAIILNNVTSSVMNCFSGTGKPVTNGIDRIRFVCANSSTLKDYLLDDVALEAEVPRVVPIVSGTMMVVW